MILIPVNLLGDKWHITIMPYHNNSVAVYLPHQCDSWDITGENSNGVTPASAIHACQSLINGLHEAIKHLNKMPAQTPHDDYSEEVC